jgi:hypothetical protein
VSCPHPSLATCATPKVRALPSAELVVSAVISTDMARSDSLRTALAFGLALYQGLLPRRSTSPTGAGGSPLGADALICYDVKVRKVRTTVTLGEDVLRWVRVRAARQGKGDSQVIEESLRRDLGLDLLERLWDKNRMDEDDAMRLAIEAQHQTRPRRRK